MVIDDSPTVRKIIEGALLRNGYAVASFENGLVAMQSLMSGATPIPAVVLLDIQLPELDGYQVARLLRSKPELKDTKIVMISSQSGPFDRFRGRVAGAFHYITKPFNSMDVLEVVRQALAAKSK
jgi:twitching motility two-component system response regulator PilG